MYYCCHGDEEEDNQSVDQNLSFKSSIESVKASLGPEDIQFLHSDKFFESSIRRLNIISYENIISGRLCNYLLSFLLYVTFGFRGYCTMSNYDLGGQCELTWLRVIIKILFFCHCSVCSSEKPNTKKIFSPMKLLKMNLPTYPENIGCILAKSVSVPIKDVLWDHLWWTGLSRAWLCHLKVKWLVTLYACTLL